MYVHQGQAQLEIEGQRTTLNEATLQVLPPLCVHGFRFAEDVEGYVLTLAAPLVSHLQAQLGATVDGLQVLGSYPAGKDSDYLNNLFARLQDEYADEQPARDMLMHALVSVLLVWISRQAIQRRHPRAPRGREYFRRFTQLVEQQYREHPKIEDLAHKLGISVSHLNGTCRELGGQPALQIMHDRQLLEAKRLLTYTSMTINEMSEVLGLFRPDQLLAAIPPPGRVFAQGISRTTPRPKHPRIKRGIVLGWPLAQRAETARCAECIDPDGN